MQTLCKNEAANRPCPRIVLVCCTALVTGGLSAEGLFQQEASEDLVHFLFGAFEAGWSNCLPVPLHYSDSFFVPKFGNRAESTFVLCLSICKAFQTLHNDNMCIPVQELVLSCLPLVSNMFPKAREQPYASFTCLCSAAHMPVLHRGFPADDYLKLADLV